MDLPVFGLRLTIRTAMLLPILYLALTFGLPPGAAGRLAHHHQDQDLNLSPQSTLLHFEPMSSSDQDSQENDFSLSNSTTNSTNSSNSTNPNEIIKNETGNKNTPNPNSSTRTPETVSVSKKSGLTDSPSLVEVEDVPVNKNTKKLGASENYKVENETQSSPTSSPTLYPKIPNAEPLLRHKNGTIPLRDKCNNTEQCKGNFTDCRLGICKCALGYLPRVDNGDLCGEASAHHVEVPQADPTMIGVVIGLVLMSITLCVVLRLFAKARFRENRTIFNTPNPRLMNVSLLKGSKSLLRGNSAGQRSRRGSQASINSEEEGPAASLTVANANSHPPSSRPRPHRQMSTDATNSDIPSSRPISSINKAKLRQDSVASNSNV